MVSTQPAIPAEGAYIGAILLDGQTTIAQFNSDMGVNHAVFGQFINFPEVLTVGSDDYLRITQLVTNCRAAGAMPMITIETMGGLDSYTTADVESFASMLFEFNIQAFLRFDHEMNGSWYPWGQQPTEFIAKFQAFADVIHEHAPNVAMAWTPNQGWGYPWAGGAYSCEASDPCFAILDTNGDGALTDADDPYGPYYPGDAYVDWVGFSFYHWSNIPDRGYNQVPYAMKFAEINGIGNAVPNFHDIFAVGHEKPMMLAETSAFYDPTDKNGGGASEADIKNGWITEVYNLSNADNILISQSLPRLHLICWFSQLKVESEVGVDVDWRLNSSDAVIAFYRSIVENPYFLKAPF